MASANQLLRQNAVTLRSVLNQTDQDPVYVINTTDLGINAQRGDIYLTVNMGGDQPELIKVDNTWIPIDLALQVPRQALLNSADFRRVVSSGRLTLVDADIAEKVLRQPDAQKESQLQNIRRVHADPAAQQQAMRDANLPSPIPQRQLARGEGFEEGVSAQVVSTINREDLGASDVLTALRNIEENLTEADLHYIMSAASGREQTRVVQFARDRLADFNNANSVKA